MGVTNITKLNKIIGLRKTRKTYPVGKKRYHTVLKTTKMAFNLEYLRYRPICLIVGYMYFKQQNTEENNTFSRIQNIRIQILFWALCNRLFHVENTSVICNTSAILSKTKQYYTFLFISLKSDDRKYRISKSFHVLMANLDSKEPVLCMYIGKTGAF